MLFMKYNLITYLNNIAIYYFSATVYAEARGPYAYLGLKISDRDCVGVLTDE